MDDITSALSSVLNDPDSMKQLQEMAAAMGLSQSTDTPSQANQQISSSPALQNTPDLSALAGMLGSTMGQQEPKQNQNQNSNTPDLSALAGLLGRAMGQGQTSQPSPTHSGSGGFDVSALTGLLGGVPGSEASSAAPTFNFDLIMKIQQAMSSMQANRKNIDFLMALKPRLNESRAQKVNDAIKIMQLIQFLPLIKESGLFGGLDNVLDGFGGNNRSSSSPLNLSGIGNLIKRFL